MSINPDITPVTICNSALAKIGGQLIMSLDDDTKEARLCREQYFKNKRAMLLEHPWNFAMRRIALTQDTETPVWGFEYMYPLPNDCLRVFQTDLDRENLEYKIEGANLVTDEPTVNILYMSSKVDESLFSESFAECLALRVAKDISYSIVQSRTLREDLEADYKMYLRQCRSYDAQEGKPDYFLTDNEGIFITSRRSSSIPGSGR